MHQEKIIKNRLEVLKSDRLLECVQPTASCPLSLFPTIIRSMKKLEQGISDFKKYIDNDCYFVDKTHLIGYLIDHPSEVHLITRPRRFGKTLNLSMIRYFFESPLPSQTAHFNTPPPSQATTQNPEPTAPNAYLFDGFLITGHPECRKYMGQYPVIALSFKNVKGTSRDENLNSIRDLIAIAFSRHDYLLDNDLLKHDERRFFECILHREGSDEDYAKSIAHLSAWLHRSYGKKVYILLDEYDTPLQSAYARGFYDQMIDFIRGFMVQTFKDNPSLQQAVVIGILKVAQESIFSDFNNPAVSTVLNDSMKNCFGFTEPEVEAMAKHFKLESSMDSIRQWYNGYIFGGDTVIYNPWSLVSYFRNIKDGLQPYWVNTSDNRLIKEVLQLDRRDSRETIEKLLKGEEVRREVMSNIAYPQIQRNPDAVWSFLLHGGYLKASERQQVRTSITYRISIPNLEVEIVYERVIKAWLEEDLEVNESFLNFIQGVREMNSAAIERNLARILFNMVSFYDTAAKPYEEETRRENFYHGLVLGLLTYLGGEYTVESNRECGMGRPDIVLVRRTGSEGGKAKEAILFEFKQGNSKRKTSLHRLAKTAYGEAVKKYLSGVREKWQPDKILVLGVGFRGKELALHSSVLS